MTKSKTLVARLSTELPGIPVISHNCDLNWTAEQSRLFEAAKNGHADYVQNNSQCTYALTNDTTRTNWLLQDEWGESLLSLACRGGHWKTVECLCETERRLGTYNNVAADIESTSLLGWRPLHFAAASGSLRVVEYLINLGAACNSRTSIGGWTPLHLAVENKHSSVAQYLVWNGAEAGIKDELGETAMDWLSRMNSEEHIPVDIKPASEMKSVVVEDQEMKCGEEKSGLDRTYHATSIEVSTSNPLAEDGGEDARRTGILAGLHTSTEGTEGTKKRKRESSPFMARYLSEFR